MREAISVVSQNAHDDRHQHGRIDRRCQRRHARLAASAALGLLAAYVGPKYFAQLGKSEVTVTTAQIDAFEKSLDTYRLDVGRYPNTEEGLAALLTAPAAAGTKWNGPYLKKNVPLDPWGHAYQYRAPGSKSEYEVMSLGKDGQPGGSGEDADISSQ